MFCSKCGKELKDGELFCSQCGTRCGTTGNSMNISTGDMKNKAIEMKNNFVSGVADLGKSKTLIFGNIILLFLSLIFSLTKVFKVDAILGMSQGMSMFVDIESVKEMDGFKDMAGVKSFALIFYLFAILMLVFPLLLRREWSTKFFLPTKIVTIATLVWFLFVLFTGLSELDSSEYSSLAEFNLSGTGWLFLVTTAGALILAYKNTVDLKKLKKSTDTTIQETANADGE